MRIFMRPLKTRLAFLFALLGAWSALGSVSYANLLELHARLPKDIQLDDYSWWHGAARATTRPSEGAVCKFEVKKVSGPMTLSKGTRFKLISIVTTEDGFYYFDPAGEAHQGRTVNMTLTQGDLSAEDQAQGLDSRQKIKMICRLDFNSQGFETDPRFMAKYFGISVESRSSLSQAREERIKTDPYFFDRLRTDSRGVE